MKKTLIILVLTFSTALTVQAKSIALQDFLQSYLQASENLKMSLQDYLASQGNTQSSKAIDDFNMKLSSGYSYQKEPQESFLTIDKRNSINTEAGVEKVFSATGTRFSLSHKLYYGDTTFGTNPYTSVAEWSYLNKQSQTAYGTSLSLSIIQPILKNLFGMLDRYPREKARLAMQIQKYYYEEQKEQSILNALNLYYNWLAVYQQNAILEEIIQNNRQILYQTQAKVKAGVAEISDLEAARSSVLLYENELYLVKNKKQELFLEIQKYYPALENIDIPDQNVLHTLYEKPLQTWRANIRPLEILKLSSAQFSLDVKAAQNSLLPNFDLIASYSLNGKDQTLSNAYSTLGTSEFFGGFQFSFPLENNEAQGKLKSTRALYEKALLIEQKTTKDLKNKYENLNYQWMQQSMILAKRTEYILSLQRKLAEENKKYRQGRMELREVLRTTNDLANAKLQKNYEQVTYHILYNQLLELLDQLKY